MLLWEAPLGIPTTPLDPKCQNLYDYIMPLQKSESELVQNDEFLSNPNVDDN